MRAIVSVVLFLLALATFVYADDTCTDPSGGPAQLCVDTGRLVCDQMPDWSIAMPKATKTGAGCSTATFAASDFCGASPGDLVCTDGSGKVPASLSMNQTQITVYFVNSASAMSPDNQGFSSTTASVTSTPAAVFTLTATQPPALYTWLAGTYRVRLVGKMASAPATVYAKIKAGATLVATTESVTVAAGGSNLPYDMLATTTVNTIVTLTTNLVVEIWASSASTNNLTMAYDATGTSYVSVPWMGYAYVMPLIAGTASVGNTRLSAMSNHVHPTEGDSTTLPLIAGTASAGTAALLSKSDHRHPAQSTIECHGTCSSGYLQQWDGTGLTNTPCTVSGNNVSCGTASNALTIANGGGSQWACGQVSDVPTLAGCGKGTSLSSSNVAIYSNGNVSGVHGSTSGYVQGDTGQLVVTASSATANVPLVGTNLTSGGHAADDVPTSRTVCGHALTSNVACSASDVGASVVLFAYGDNSSSVATSGGYTPALVATAGFTAAGGEKFSVDAVASVQGSGSGSATCGINIRYDDTATLGPTYMPATIYASGNRVALASTAVYEGAAVGAHTLKLYVFSGQEGSTCTVDAHYGYIKVMVVK